VKAASSRPHRSSRLPGTPFPARAGLLLVTVLLCSALVAISGAARRPSVVAVGTSGPTSCALFSSGTLECWGNDTYGRLGDGKDANRRVSGGRAPVTVKGITGATAISVGGEHTCALLAGGSVTCWGEILGAQSVNGKVPYTSTPVRVKGISGATALSTGAYSSCVVLADRKVKCWGGVGGALGSGKLASSRTPVVVKGLP
jgi:alpha-tubulin suppressor-like RCC1 family protein